MKIKEVYQNSYFVKDEDYEFILGRVNNDIFVGEDKLGTLTLLVRSDKLNCDRFHQNTKKLIIETDQKVTCTEHGIINECFHILRCATNELDEKLIFLELCDAYFKEKMSSNDILKIFMTLDSFFEDKISISDQELQGLFGELYTIYNFLDKFDFSRFWQSKDRLNFDFSISSKVKLEIKTTVKSERMHRFKHEQLANKIFDIYVLSYKLQQDDCGLELYDLINECITIFEYNPKVQQRLIHIKHSCGEDRLRSFKYSEKYVQSNLKFYKAENIPHYIDVDGVSGANYNSNIENIQSENIENVLQYFKSVLEEGKNV